MLILQMCEPEKQSKCPRPPSQLAAEAERQPRSVTPSPVLQDQTWPLPQHWSHSVSSLAADISSSQPPCQHFEGPCVWTSHTLYLGVCTSARPEARWEACFSCGPGTARSGPLPCPRHLHSTFANTLLITFSSQSLVTSFPGHCNVLGSLPPLNPDHHRDCGSLHLQPDQPSPSPRKTFW